MFRDPAKWKDISVGYAHGLSGDMSLDTDCVKTTDEVQLAVQDFGLSLFYVSQANFIEPFHLFSYIAIAIGNQNVACALNTQATQFSLRTSSTAGAGDLMYTLADFPIAGFFNTEITTEVQTENQIWEAFTALW